jgi:endonuclease/exonuclease/phosphatase family metal-dependent hydrolase
MGRVLLQVVRALSVINSSVREEADELAESGTGTWCGPGRIVINEVLPRPSSGPEWVELYNSGCQDVDLSGWRLIEAAGKDGRWSGNTLAAGAHLTIEFYSKLNNKGDTLTLYDHAGAVVDSFSYGRSMVDLSWQRVPDGGPWSDQQREPTRVSSPTVTTTPKPTSMTFLPLSPPCGGCNGTCFGTWNIQNLGRAKGGRPAVLAVIRMVLAHFDVVAIQELSQLPGPPYAWCGKYTESVICDALPDTRSFAVKASPRIGDEQYVVMYRTESAELNNTGTTYPDPRGIHSRSPHAFDIRIKRGNIDRLVLAVTHTSPEHATEEIQNFPAVLEWMQQSFRGTEHYMLAGDFNADGRYFRDEHEWQDSELPLEWEGYVQLTSNSMDTTVASNDHTYDRIVASRALGDLAANAKVLRLESFDMTSVFQEGCSVGYVPSSLCEREDLVGKAWNDFPSEAKAAVAREVSDHHPIEVCLG